MDQPTKREMESGKPTEDDRVEKKTKVLSAEEEEAATELKTDAIAGRFGKLTSKGVLLVYNVSKKNNVGNIFRSASAFGIVDVVVAGSRKLTTFGHKGTKKHLRFHYFEKFDDAVRYLKDDGYSICGIEIDERSQDVATHPFKGKTAFILGNEGSGLNDKAAAACDQFVYIKHAGAGTASLNVSVAAGIVLHHFCEWSGMPEAQRHDNKFVVSSSKGSEE